MDQPTGVGAARTREDVERLLVVIREGARKTSPRPRRSGASAVISQVEGELSRILPETEVSLLLGHSQIEQAAIIAAQTGDFAAANDAIEAFRQRLNNDLSEPGRLFIETHAEAMAAYVQYRRGQFDNALESLTAALLATSVLVDTYGLRALGARRIHLVNNYVRVLRRANEIDRAVETAFGAIRFAEGSTLQLPVDCPPALTVVDPQDQAYQSLVDELGFELMQAAGSASCDLTALAGLAASHLNKEESRCAFYPDLHHWLELKVRHVCGHVEEFIEAALLYQADRADSRSQYWHAVLLDTQGASARCVRFAWLCESLDALN